VCQAAARLSGLAQITFREPQRSYVLDPEGFSEQGECLGKNCPQLPHVPLPRVGLSSLSTFSESGLAFFPAILLNHR